MHAVETHAAGAGRIRAASVPPQAYFVVSAVFHYLGPAFAVLLFARNAAALACAVAGVYLVTGIHLAGEPAGIAFAFANAGLFAAYIVLAHRVARLPQLTGIDGLAASMLIAAIVITPVGGVAVIPALADPVALAAGAGVGICSSVIPYVADQLAMRRLARATYALMVSLLPATATVIGVVVLSQLPSITEVTGVALVMAGVAAHESAA
jgi:inner membrane transporter RhtA